MKFRLQAQANDLKQQRLPAIGQPRVVSASGIHLDLSRHFLTDETLTHFETWADTQKLADKRTALFQGKKVNTTEDRAALHTELRNPKTGYKAIPETLARMERFVADNAFTDVVNLGMGGSDLGPRMVCEALRPFSTGKVRCHFVSNIDPAELAEVLAPLQAENTLFIVASKSFTTFETLRNFERAVEWLTVNNQTIAEHCVAITANTEKATAAGFDGKHIFPFWDFVGGRYSVWSAIGLPIALQCGMPVFRELLTGAHEMDQHFSQAPLASNLPVLMGMIDCWYRDYFDTNALAVLPYAHALRSLPRYLQQLVMESLGKSVKHDGSPVEGKTCGILWGEPGTNAQHAFQQMLLQGTDMIPVDFIAVKDADPWLMANAKAQAQVLAEGTPNESNPHKRILGNRPSSLITLETLDAKHLGALLSLYEHKTFVQAVLWEINPFDQFGVERGKVLAKEIYKGDAVQYRGAH